MKILITGANGQLGNEMRLALAQENAFEPILSDIDTLDICNSKQIESFIELHMPKVIVNCAAYTAVDKAEDDVQACYRINRDAVKNIAHAAAKHDIKIIHISTDYVFDGNAHLPYDENMTACPTTVYGKSKLEGEQILLQLCPQAVILRTAWLYSSFGNNFVKTMLRLGAERRTLNVIFDQIGSPTYAADLADAIIAILKNDKWTSGIFHFSNEGVCSWYDFAKAIFDIAGIKCSVNPIESNEYIVRTPRPHYSVLNKKKIKQTFGIEIPYWRTSLQHCIKLLTNS